MSDTREPDFEAVEEGQVPPAASGPDVPTGETEEVPPEHTRPRARLLPMWILIAAVVIVGVAWAMSERYFGEADGNKIVPLVTAEQTPVKVRPEEPGGVEVPDRDKYVYKSLTDAEPEAEQLLPPPEEPMQRPPVEAIETTVPAASAETMKPAVEPEMAQAPEPPPPADLAVAEVKAPTEVVAEQADEALEGAGITVATVEAPKATFDVLETIDAAAAASPEPEPEPELPAAPQQSAALSADSPGFLVQIGATQNEAAAHGEIARLAKKHPDILAELSSIVIRADLGAKGVWYRMRVGPLATRGGSDGVCDQLKAVDVGCFVVAN
ncbi:MAG: SPOR domain-containing protein [Alphaproteobacteria bacterium]